MLLQLYMKFGIEVLQLFPFTGSDYNQVLPPAIKDSKFEEN